uniref:WD repeat-containing protein 55 homolog n=1 Tax=Strigamia maritima TaxID=126957 RepID=T1IQJ7_STRMM
MASEMFSSVVIEGETIKSSWKSDRRMKDSESQTGVLEMKDSECQAIERTSAEVQTLNLETQHLILAEYDEKSLGAFLTRITPALLKELDKNLRSNVFQGYDLINDESTELLTKVHSLKYSDIPDEMFGCTGVSWNCTGTVVAVSYGYRQHENWCDHHGIICSWSLDRVDFEPNTPQKKFEHSCCITSITFCPKTPFLIAAGTFIGEVLLLDTSENVDMLLSSTETGEKGHHDTVTDIAWVGNENGNLQLVTCGLDGKILIWERNTQSIKLKLHKAFIILAGNLPTSLRIKSSRQFSEVGINSMSFNVEDKCLFVIGSEGGGVLQCSLESQLPTNSDIKFVMDLKNPVALGHNPHKGHVNSVASSPFSRNIFVSCGSDGEIRIYNYNQANAPLRTIYSENSPIRAAWSPTKPLLIAVVTANGLLNVYDLRLTEKPIVSSKLAEDGLNACVLEFSHKNPKYLATGAEDASVQIWSLHEKLIVPASNELETLHKMGKII